MNKLIRPKVIIGKPSLETLVELNAQAEKVGAVVVIGALPEGESMLGGSTVEPIAFYMIIETSIFADDAYKDFPTDNHFALSKEEVLTKLLSLASAQAKKE